MAKPDKPDKPDKPIKPDKPDKFKPISINIHIKNIEEAELYYNIFNSTISSLSNNTAITDSAFFLRLKKRLEKQGINTSKF